MKTMDRHELQNRIGRLKDKVIAQARQYWTEIASAEAPVGVLAFAFTAGLLISTIPVPMIDMALAGLVLRRFSRLPRAPFLAAMAMTNNLVMAPVYASTPKVGGFALHWLAGRMPVALPEALAVQVLVGYLLIVVGLAFAGYALAGTGFYSYRKFRRVAWPDR
jgi:hypothetical protein